MPGYQVSAEEDVPYFVTTATIGWAHVFTSTRYFEILVEALAYCRANKGLDLYAYVVMTNHFHVIARTRVPGALSGVMRDFKRHTSREIMRQLQEDGNLTLAKFFSDTPLKRAGNTGAKVWQDDFHPVALADKDRFLQRLEYLELNPVRKGYVDEPDHWHYSSARNRIHEDQSVLEVDLLGW